MTDKKDKPQGKGQSKDKNKPQDEAGQIDLIGPSCGERLLAARQAKSVTVAEIAKELHISEQKVEALERNEFETLGAQVFAKGYIRKYAQMVGVDADEIVADYVEIAAADTQPLFKARRRPRREMSPGPWIAVIVLIVVIATIVLGNYQPAGVVQSVGPGAGCIDAREHDAAGQYGGY